MSRRACRPGACLSSLSSAGPCRARPLSPARRLPLPLGGNPVWRGPPAREVTPAQEGARFPRPRPGPPLVGRLVVVCRLSGCLSFYLFGTEFLYLMKHFSHMLTVKPGYIFTRHGLDARWRPRSCPLLPRPSGPTPARGQHCCHSFPEYRSGNFLPPSVIPFERALKSIYLFLVILLPNPVTAMPLNLTKHAAEHFGAMVSQSVLERILTNLLENATPSSRFFQDFYPGGVRSHDQVRTGGLACAHRLSLFPVR